MLGELAMAGLGSDSTVLAGIVNTHLCVVVRLGWEGKERESVVT